jgi:hypothetical protein
MYFLFYVVLCIVSVYMCTVLLPPGGYSIAVNKYIISHHIIYLFSDKAYTACQTCRPAEATPLLLQVYDKNYIVYWSSVLNKHFAILFVQIFMFVLVLTTAPIKILHYGGYLIPPLLTQRSDVGIRLGERCLHLLYLVFGNGLMLTVLCRIDGTDSVLA